ncbi:MAG: hypothetical protein ACKO2C_06950 [Actinomycetes bacterium]
MTSAPTIRPAPVPRGHAAAVAVVAVLTIGVLIAAVRLARLPWYPASDLALAELAVRRVGTSHTPLLGAYSRYGWAHPGPALWYVLAPWYRLGGERSATLLAGVFLLDVASVATTLGVLLRRAGARITIVAGALLIPLLVAIGTNDLLIPWNARVYVLPLLALTVLTWSAGLGDGRWTLAAVVVVGGFIAQAHAGTSLLVGLCTIWALTGLRHRRDRGAVLGFAALAGALMWAPALLDAARHGGGNLSTLAGFSLGGDGTRAGYALAWDRLADTLSPRAFWLLGQHPTIELDGTLSPRGGGAWGLLLLAAGTVIAHRRRATRVVALGLLAAAFDLACLVSVAQVRPPVFPYLVGYLHVAGWLTVTAGAAGVLTLLPPTRLDRLLRATTPVVVVAIVAGFVVVGLRAPTPGTSDAAQIRALLPGSTRGVRGCTAVDVRSVETYAAFGAAQGVALQWVRSGRTVTFDPDQTLEYGPLARPAEPGACRVLFTVGSAASYTRARVGDTVLATYDALNPRDRRAYAQLRTRLDRLLDAYTRDPRPAMLARIRRAFAEANRRFPGGGGDPLVVVLRAPS